MFKAIAPPVTTVALPDPAAAALAPNADTVVLPDPSLTVLLSGSVPIRAAPDPHGIMSCPVPPKNTSLPVAAFPADGGAPRRVCW